MSAKQDLLALYDYGMGGVWAIIQARSADEIPKSIRSSRSSLTPPAWMDDDHYEKISAARTFDIDEPPTGWLLTAVILG